MTDPRRCPDCQAELPPDAPAGQCPACLLKAGLGAASTAPLGADGSSTGPGRRGFVSPTPAELAPLFPQLELLELIGQGGMGAVYKARQTHLDRIVALKVLPPGLGKDAGFVERFAREARALARLNHPHLVTIHDFGQNGDWCWILMEYVDGANLRQVLSTGRLSPQQALAIVPQLCEALQYAHDEGIIHRDIKPENILMDRRGRVKIADFGLAKLVEPESAAQTLTASNDVMGTVHYMAPEQVERSGDVDHRVDIYSLGVVIYEMLTGGLPLGRFALPSQKCTVDARLDEVVMKALEKDPQRRYQQAGEVKTDVERIGGSPPEAVRNGSSAAAPPPPAPAIPEAAKAPSPYGKSPAGDGILLMVLGAMMALLACQDGHAAGGGGDSYDFMMFAFGAVMTWGGWHLLHERDLRWVTAAKVVALISIPFSFMLNVWLGIGVIVAAVRLLSVRTRVRVKIGQDQPRNGRGAGRVAADDGPSAPRVIGRAWGRHRAGFLIVMSIVLSALVLATIRDHSPHLTQDSGWILGLFLFAGGGVAFALARAVAIGRGGAQEHVGMVVGLARTFSGLIVSLLLIAIGLGLMACAGLAWASGSPAARHTLVSWGITLPPMSGVGGLGMAPRDIGAPAVAISQAVARMAALRGNYIWGSGEATTASSELHANASALEDLAEEIHEPGKPLPSAQAVHRLLRSIEQSVEILDGAAKMVNTQLYAGTAAELEVIGRAARLLDEHPEQVGAIHADTLALLERSMVGGERSVAATNETARLALTEAAKQYCFTSAQAQALIERLPWMAERPRIADLLRPRLTDPEHAFAYPARAASAAEDPWQASGQAPAVAEPGPGPAKPDLQPTPPNDGF